MVAFILVAIACGVVIAQGLRASALTVVISGRAPAAFALGSVPGALFGPVLVLRPLSSDVVRPVLIDGSDSLIVARPVRTGVAGSGQLPARAVVHTAPAAAVVPPAVVTPAVNKEPAPASSAGSTSVRTAKHHVTVTKSVAKPSKTAKASTKSSTHGKSDKASTRTKGHARAASTADSHGNGKGKSKH